MSGHAHKRFDDSRPRLPAWVANSPSSEVQGGLRRNRRVRPGVAVMILVLSFNTTLLAQGARDELLLAVSPTDSTLSIIKVEGKTMTTVATVPVGKGAREEVCVS